MMAGNTGFGTSLMLIAIGAILAFAVNYQTAGIDINAVGGILLVVGLIGMVLSFMFLGTPFTPPRDTHSHTHYVTPEPPVTHETVVHDAAGTRRVHERDETITPH
jgi:hypothetical protein